MAVEAHLSEIADQHKSLDRRIREELEKPGSDDLKIAQLKREKLRLKDELKRRQPSTRH